MKLICSGHVAEIAQLQAEILHLRSRLPELVEEALCLGETNQYPPTEENVRSIIDEWDKGNKK